MHFLIFQGRPNVRELAVTKLDHKSKQLFIMQRLYGKYAENTVIIIAIQIVNDYMTKMGARDH